MPEQDMEMSLPAGQLEFQLGRSWGLSQIKGMDREQLEAALAIRLNQMVQEEFERLVQIMYRLDVDEGKFQLALASSPPGKELARLVIDREIKRLYYRNLYSNKS